MKEFLSQKGVDFREVNVAEDAGGRDEMLAKSRVLAVPQVLVDNEMVIGFDRQRLDQLLH